MGSLSVFLLLAWGAGMLMSSTYGGALHALPVVAAVLGLLAYQKKKRDAEPKKQEIKLIKARTTWKA
jgi:hypothetical protein